MNGIIHVPLKRFSKKLTRNKRLEFYQVTSAIKDFRKPKSMVVCDLFPNLVTKYSDLFALPLTVICNTCFSNNVWPELWKDETVVVIPKVKCPTSLGEYRNLSCTPLFSKILESFVLNDLKKEVKIEESQYGGIRGSGSQHYLIKTWNKILEALEEKDAAVNLLSIDFKEAFNLIKHNVCIAALRNFGASELSLAMVTAFLDRRKLRVKLGEVLSSAKVIKGGIP